MSQVTQAYVDEEQGTGSGNSYRLIINALIDAALTKNSGTTPPPDPRPFMEWYDTQADALMQRDTTNTVWLYLRSFGKASPPTLGENELSNYPQGSEWFTTDARAFKHVGGGTWVDLGEAQQASLFAPTMGVLGGKRFAAESDSTISSVVMGGPRFALGASTPTPLPPTFTYGLIPSVRTPITSINVASSGTDPQFVMSGLFSYLQVTSTTTGYLYFDIPILTAPTFIILNISHFLASGSVGTLPFEASTARLTDMSAIVFGTATTLTLAATSAANIKQTSQLLLASAGAVIGDVLRVRLRRNGGTAGPVTLTDLWIEQNP